MIVCFTCAGQKKVYQSPGGHSLINIGGKKIDCPLCKGVGMIKPIEEAPEEVKKLVEEAVAAEAKVKAKSNINGGIKK